MRSVQAITFDDVLLVPCYNHYESRRDVDISMTDRCGKLQLALPVFSANMDSITQSTMADFMGSQGGMGVLHRFMSIEANINEFKLCQHKVFVSVGCSDKEIERAIALKDAGAEYFCLDVAHSHARYVGKTIKILREVLGDRCIMAGNVATYAGADYLAANGADLIKVGIGGGSVCTTRLKTGFGVPMLTAIQECARVDRSIIADGGIRRPGDIVKALAFGADFVMIGGMLAGVEATPGKVIEIDGKKFKEYRGMASKEAQEDFLGALPEWKTAEGVSLNVPLRFDQAEILADIRGGLRSGLTYGGAATIKELQRKLDYLQISSASFTESTAHHA